MPSAASHHTRGRRAHRPIAGAAAALVDRDPPGVAPDAPLLRVADTLAGLTDDVIELPKVEEALDPLLYTLPAQLLAYEIAARRGCDVDQPRNLANSVTVE